MARLAPRRDAGEWAVIHILRARGCHVEQLDGWGLPDLLVLPPEGSRFGGQVVLIEVKDPPGPKGGTSRDGQRLNEAQVEFFAQCSGRKVLSVFVAHNADEALERLGLT